MILDFILWTLGADALAFAGCALATVDQEAGYFRRITPRVVAAVTVWPLSLLFLVCWGLYEWVPGRAPLDPRANDEQLLSPRQRKQLAYDRARVQIHAAANAEAERTQSIIQGELTE